MSKKTKPKRAADLSITELAQAGKEAAGIAALAARAAGLPVSAWDEDRQKVQLTRESPTASVSGRFKAAS
jgi:3-hydroxyacyl-CoA dehydrogenase